MLTREGEYFIKLLKQKNKFPSYEEVVLKIFEEIETLKDNEPVVMKVVEKFQ